MTFLDKQPPLQGEVVAHCYRLERLGCDIALVSLQGDVDTPLSNTARDSSGKRFLLKIFGGQAADILNNDCFKFENGFNTCLGRVTNVKFGYNYKLKLSKVTNCIAVVRKDDPQRSFVEEGDCGKIVTIRQQQDPHHAYGFGILFGEVEEKVMGEGDIIVQHIALLTDLPKALALLNSHEYCDHNLQLINA